MAILPWLTKKLHRYKLDYTDLDTIQFNLQKDEKDSRDYPVKTTFMASQVPNSFSLEEYVHEVKNQGSIGSCGSNAILSAYELLMKKNYPSWAMPGSELFHYYNVRVMDGSFPMDKGQTIKNGIKSMRVEGFCPEVLCPYYVSQFNNKPGIFSYSFAKHIFKRKFPIKEYNRCWSVNDMTRAIADGRPIILGTKIYRNFLSYKKGIYDTPNGRLLGGHATLGIKFDKKEKTLTILNSWGENFGESGYANLSFDYVKNNLIDAWTINI